MHNQRLDEPTILVVDGDFAAAKSLVERLESTRMHCTHVTDIEDACQALVAGEIDVVVVSTDWQPSLCSALAGEVSKNGAVLLCSGEGDSRDEMAAAMRLGARGFLCKPWPDATELQVTIQDCLRASTDLCQRSRRRDARQAELEKKYEMLKSDFAEQRTAFEGSQEIFYLDLSRMMNIIGNIMDGIVFADCDGHITLMNPVAEDFLGTKSFIAIGQRVSDLEGSVDLVAAMREDHGRVDGQRECLRTVEVHEDSRDLTYVKMHTSQVLDYCGKPAGTLTVMQDVTSEYKSDQLKNQYLSIVAHELRTPLTGIKTFSTMMAKGSLGDLSEKQQRVMESIREQSLRLEHQIDKLINLGHIESNEYGQDLEVFDLKEVVQQASAPFELPASDRSIAIQICVPEAPVIIRGDRVDLRRAIQALIENALKFTSDSGEISVEIVSAEGQSQVTVCDTGIGIDPRYHQRILEKFFQVEDPLTRHHGGAGLGLFFVQGIISAHGSEIRVESELGQGAKFSFNLPTCEEGVELASTGCAAAPSQIR